MKPLDWFINENYAADHVGQRTLLIDADNPLPAATQLAQLGYPNAPPGGWSMTEDMCLVHEGAPPLPPAAYAIHHAERVYIYPAGLVACLQLNGGFSLFLVK